MDEPLSEVFPKEAIRIDVEVEDWREAVRESGRLLVETGVVEERYVDAIEKAIDDLGPYIVLAPGIAIAHSRPEEGALEVGFSLVRLVDGVEFGAGDKDPVDLVFAFASPDNQQHLKALGALADFIEKKQNLEGIRSAETVDELHQVIRDSEIKQDIDEESDQ